MYGLNVGGSSSDTSYIGFDSNDKFVVSTTWGGVVRLNLVSTQVFRDPSAWYHIVVSLNATAGTALIYVNGQQITSFSTNTMWSAGSNGYFNTSGNGFGIGSRNLGEKFDGYMAEYNFIDGQALTPSSFGATNASTGVWQPKKYAGTYGTNGFYLPFSDNSSTTTLTQDRSGNGNNWTANNISLTSGATYDSMTDVPTLWADGGNGRGNYATLNPLNSAVSSQVGNANLRFTRSGNSWGTSPATIAVSTGKWYFEYTIGTVSASGILIGIASSDIQYIGQTVYVGQASASYGYNSANGQKYNNNAGTSYGATFTTGDVIGVALDLDAGTLTFYKNNVSQGTAYSSLSGTFVPAASAFTTNDFFDVNFGQRPFAYTPPTGFVALNTFNLPTPTIGATASTQANKYFDATLWTGTGATLSLTNSGSMQPDLVWAKTRSAVSSNLLYDSIRGVNNYLSSNQTAAEATLANSLTAFNSNGFTVGSDSNINGSGVTNVAWQWNAGGSTVTNTSGSISSQVRANTSAGFSVVTYTGTGANATVGHGLGVAPRMIITKCRGAATNWTVYHASIGNTAAIYLNATNAQDTNVLFWNNTTPTSTVFTIGNQAGNTSGQPCVAYCFSAIAGYSAFTSYTGNGSSDGTFVHLGFRPRFVMIKNSSATGAWIMYDTARDTSNVVDLILEAQSSSAEGSGSPFADIDFLSNGFKIRGTSSAINTNGNTYVVAAFAENPFKYSLGR
jgi:hypothetical protein